MTGRVQRLCWTWTSSTSHPHRPPLTRKSQGRFLEARQVAARHEERERRRRKRWTTRRRSSGSQANVATTLPVRVTTPLSDSTLSGMLEGGHGWPSFGRRIAVTFCSDEWRRHLYGLIRGVVLSEMVCLFIYISAFTFLFLLC